MKNQSSILINASPEDVFYWLDNASRVMLWLPNIVENEDLETTEDGVGSTFRQVYVEQGQRMEMFGTVTKYEKNRRSAVEITGDMFDLSVEYLLEAQGEQTLLTQYTTVRFKGFFLKTFGPMISWFTKKSSQKSLDDSFAKLKELAEAGPEANGSSEPE